MPAARRRQELQDPGSFSQPRSKTCPHHGGDQTVCQGCSTQARVPGMPFDPRPRRTSDGSVATPGPSVNFEAAEPVGPNSGSHRDSGAGPFCPVAPRWIVGILSGASHEGHRGLNGDARESGEGTEPEAADPLDRHRGVFQRGDGRASRRCGHGRVEPSLRGGGDARDRDLHSSRLRWGCREGRLQPGQHRRPSIRKHVFEPRHLQRRPDVPDLRQRRAASSLRLRPRGPAA